MTQIQLLSAARNPFESYLLSTVVPLADDLSFATISFRIKEMVAALILVISSVMMVQFVVFLWRANMLATAAQPISETLSSAQIRLGQAVNLGDFDTVAALSELCPAMGMQSVSVLAVRAYYHAIRLLSQLCSAILPQADTWARQEMAFCSRFVAVLLDRRLASNQIYLAALRPY